MEQSLNQTERYILIDNPSFPNWLWPKLESVEPEIWQRFSRNDEVKSYVIEYKIGGLTLAPRLIGEN